MSDQIVAPETRDLDDLATALTGWLSAKMPDATDLRIDNLDYPRGAGMSHETILFDAHWSEDGQAVERGMVVRIKPGHHTVFPDSLFEEQFNVMKLMHQDGRVRVAEVLWLENDLAVLGKPFFLMEKKHGRVPVSMPPYARTGWVYESTPEQHRMMWEQGVRQLALIQRVQLDQFGFLRGPAHAEQGFAQEWDKYVRFVEWVKDSAYYPVLKASLARLEATFPKNRPDGLVWGDARLGNMMFNDSYEVVAVMDWEQPSLGGALQDLAWFLTLSETMHGKTAMHGGHLPGMGTREETIALWEEVSGKSAADIEWYEEFTHLKMSCTGVRLTQLRGVEMMSIDAMRARLNVG